MRITGTFLATLVFALSASPAGTTLLFGDQDLDSILLTRDRNGDGDAADANESRLFFGAGNASGLTAPTGNVFAIQRTDDGSVVFGDGDTDTIYRVRDLNGDRDAMDAGEAAVWFSAGNAGGLPLLTPNGVAQGGDGAIYVVEADVLSTPNGDFVYRTVDLNSDGDANDAGEASTWLDLKALNGSSSAFEILFDDDAAYVIDTAGSDSNRIYRAQDLDNSGAVDSGEVSVFIDDTNVFGAPVDFAMAIGDDGSLFTIDLTGSHQVFRLVDLDGSGSIDAAGEATEVWNDTFLPVGFDALAAFDIAFAEDSLFWISNAGGSSPEGDSIYRLTDLDQDGTFFGAGETAVWSSRTLTGDVPSRGRSLAAFQVVPEPGTLPLMAGALALLAFAARRRA